MLVLQILCPYLELETLSTLFGLTGDAEYLYHAGQKVGHKVFSLRDFECTDGIIEDKHKNSVTFRTCPQKKIIYIQYATINSIGLIDMLPSYFIEREIKTIKKQNFKCMLKPAEMAAFLIFGNNTKCAFSNNGVWVPLLA